MKKYKVTVENLQTIFDYLGVKADMREFNGQLIITSDAGHGHFMTAFPSVK